jgi:hypothetical protein
MALQSGFASASVCSVSSASACASHDPRWPRSIRPCKKHIRKNPSLDAGRQRRSLGHRRGALSAAWLALPHVDPARNQGPCPPARPHPQECGAFRGRACGMGALCSVWKPANSMGPASCSFFSNSVPPAATAADGLWSSPTTPVYPPLPPAPTVAGIPRPSLCLGLPSQLRHAALEGNFAGPLNFRAHLQRR